jgi:hypothetical protein
MQPPLQAPDADLMQIALTMSADAGSRFLPMLGEGIFFKGPGGQTVERFLVETAGIPLAYLKERVQTVFLDGRALDDFSTARLADGAVLALSAAMPGRAGAVLRRGGFYASMRRQISHDAQARHTAEGSILVTLKLFNMIARELGPAFLQEGVLVPGPRLEDFIQRRGRWVWQGCLSADADGRPVNPVQIAERLSGRRWVRLSVRNPG